MKLLDRVVESTTEYIETMPKTLRKKYGQFLIFRKTVQKFLYLIPVQAQGYSLLLFWKG